MADPVQAQTPQPPAQYRWIPIRSLVSRHRGRVLSHLLALSAEDRYLRFGYMASDEQIKRYVERLDFHRDEIFGIFNRRLQLIAMAHLAYLSDGMLGTSGQQNVAEFGVSVTSAARGRGYGARLFDHAVLHARNRGVTQLIIHALSENTAMLRIARNAGASVVRDGGEAEARLQLPGDSLASRMEALVESQAAELDYRFKSNAQHMDRLVNFFSFGLLRSRKQAAAANSELDATQDPPEPRA
ncbi:MAG TPA: GNAT family N-acetyltransferase [Ideonella sp.]|uniref:GNAT family N-acetyltransferase n=1 Tax=Ideonella sp. TaxID=1929293 RepID=UPI002BDFA1A4|nr:GNAT family N-acetyltransferase [Ideonella sp.]HSI49906.1 GNAT family N-acetyltransferase [Ideonella sp.]